MGVPQRRERVFFIALRKDLAGQFLQQMDMFTVAPKLDLVFNEKGISYGEIKESVGNKISDLYYSRWEKRKPTDTKFGDITERTDGTGSCFSDAIVNDMQIMPTILSKGYIVDYNTGHFISEDTFKKAGTYPMDYKFEGNKPPYLIGMSVPPVMTAQIASEIYSQWLSKIPN